MNEYLRDYDDISFKVHFSYKTENPDKIHFAAHPYERLEEIEEIDNPSL